MCDRREPRFPHHPSGEQHRYRQHGSAPGGRPVAGVPGQPLPGRRLRRRHDALYRRRRAECDQGRSQGARDHQPSRQALRRGAEEIAAVSG